MYQENYSLPFGVLVSLIKQFMKELRRELKDNFIRNKTPRQTTCKPRQLPHQTTKMKKRRKEVMTL